MREDTRKGWMLKCPFCSKDVAYTKLVNWNPPVPFFYCGTSNAVLLRKSDEKYVAEHMVGKKLSVPELEDLWNEVLARAPKGPKGEEFKFWANVHCPYCAKEFPYNNGVRNSGVRINDPEVILIDGATVIGDTEADSWKVRVLPEPMGF